MTQAGASQLFGLFPVPLQRVAGALDADTVAGLVRRFTERAQQQNAQSDRLTHTEPVTPKDHPLLAATSRAVVPHVIDFGALLLGERLHWSIKEMWVSVLEPGGRQALHNHANSFVSGVIYLTASHRSANTVFMKSPGGTDFIFNNTNARAQLGPYNADKWVSPDPAPGDLVLFPSYLLHEVPENRGERRISLAFNAIPNRLDSWGYTLSLGR
jgi:uncharacterized protein (TIGR02466 family)